MQGKMKKTFKECCIDDLDSDLWYTIDRSGKCSNLKGSAIKNMRKYLKEPVKVSIYTEEPELSEKIKNRRPLR